LLLAPTGDNFVIATTARAQQRDLLPENSAVDGAFSRVVLIEHRFGVVERHPQV
jgi:hypothetical protein